MNNGKKNSKKCRKTIGRKVIVRWGKRRVTKKKKKKWGDEPEKHDWHRAMKGEIGNRKWLT